MTKAGGLRRSRCETFMSEVLRFVNISIEGWGILFCFVAVIVLLVGTKVEEKTRNLFIVLFLSIAVDLWSNVVGLLTRGKIDPLGSAIVGVANFCEFFFGYLTAFVFALFVIHTVSGEDSRGMKLYRNIFAAIFLTEIILLVLNQFHPFIYFIDFGSIYHRGNFFWVSQFLGLLSMGVDAFIVIKYRQRLSKKELIALSIYIVLPIAALILQNFIYGIYLNLLASIISSIVMVVCMVSDQMEKYVSKESENAQMHQAIMLSQIQPHFLHNSLTAIAQLCEVDPKEAKRAIIKFSMYLRENMNSLKQKDTIPFDKELEHLKTYLYLEQLRFGERLRVEFDIETSNFNIPVLSVQPLVENAVKHGIGMKEEGGCVKIKTTETESHIEIIIRDDGAGFDPDEEYTDDRIHVGIDNVRRRLEDMCGGTLDIASRIGEGCMAVISIPREKKE